MARLLLLICLVVAVLALLGAAVTAWGRAAQEGRKVASDLTARSGENNVERISYAALFLLMLGVTSGLLGGL